MECVQNSCLIETSFSHPLYNRFTGSRKLSCHYPTVKRIIATLITICLFSTFAARTSAEDGYSPVSGINILKRLEKSVSELVGDHYPDATTNAFQDVIHFEHSTRLYITQADGKVPGAKKAQRVVVRGPMKGGVWCDIRFKNWAAGDREPSPPVDTAVVRRGFVEYVFHPNDAENHCHLAVTLRLPSDPTDQEKKFLEALRKQLQNFGPFIDRQTSGPQTTTLRRIEGKPQPLEGPAKNVDANPEGALVLVKAFDAGLVRKTLGNKAVSPDKNLFAGCYRDGFDQVISIHETRSGKQITRIAGQGDNVRELRFTPDGKIVASWCRRYGWALWNVESGERILRLPVPESEE